MLVYGVKDNPSAILTPPPSVLELMSTTRPDYNFSFTFLDQLWSVQNELNCMSGRKSRSISLRLNWMIVLHILHSDAICQCLICGLLYNEKVFNLAFYMFIDIEK